nr:RHS repeat-associated core domain-containing protein [Tahibacter harae]
MSAWEVGGTSGTITGSGTAQPPQTGISQVVSATPYQEPEPAPDPYSDSVGATPGSFRVDEGGSSNYTIPLYVPPGTADLSPKLSLAYQQRGGNGSVGVGFGIGGLSAVTRCRKTREDGDGVGPFPAINFDADFGNDAYCLDGTRVRNRQQGAGTCPSTSGASATEYGIETDPATRVCGYEKVGVTGPAFWLVQPKDGSYRRYGVAGDSALPRNDGNGAVDGTQLLTWSLDRIADASGNVIEYRYERNAGQGEINIAEVVYTGRVALSNLLSDPPSYSRAPYNTVQFVYDVMPAASQRVDYLSGMKLTLSRRLTRINVKGTANRGADPDALEIVRSYYLEYSVPTASGLQAVSAVRECAPDGVNEVCYPRTRFTWNGNDGNTQGFPTAPTSTAYGGGMQYAIDFKLADVNSDGRQDLVWLKDGACDSSGSGNTRFQVMTSLATGTLSGPGYAAPTATGIYLQRPPVPPLSSLPGCGGDLRPQNFQTLWHIFDFTGDGRDDILAGNGLAWIIYPAVNNGSGWTYSGATSTSTGIVSTSTDDGRLVDLDADGLPDFLRGSDGQAVVARYLRRTASTTVAYSFSATDVIVDLENPAPPPGGYVPIGHTFLSPSRGVPPSADIDGDGASDLAIKITYEGPASDGCPSSGSLPQREQNGYLTSLVPDDIDALDCKRFWFTYRNAGIQPNGRLLFAVDSALGQIGGVNGLSGGGGDLQLADINGDGQADVLYQRINGTQRSFHLKLNAGKATTAGTERLLPEQATGLSLEQDLAARMQLLDVNGDGKLDLFYTLDLGGGSQRYPLRARRYEVSGFGAEIEVGNSTSNSQNPLTTPTFVADVTGDGVADLVRHTGSNMHIARGSSTLGGNDLVTYIVNGLGAVNTIGYAPLPYSSVYGRAFDAPSKVWGRGSPVFDVFASMWVVRSAWQTAPTAANGADVSQVRYYYSGARMQAGGRGFLGFQTVRTEDPQNLLVTTTEYRQDYPYAGRPVRTIVEKMSAPLPDPCASNPNAAGCHWEPPSNCGPLGCPIAPGGAALLAAGGQLLSDSATTWTAEPAFNPANWQPVHVYGASTDEQKFDLATADQLSYQLGSTFQFDRYGNLLSSTTTASHVDDTGSLQTDESKITNNVYGCTLAPPTVSGCAGSALNAERQRLGRLSISTVESIRSGAGSVKRRASFEYDSSRLLLVAEIQGPYDAGDEPDADQRKRLGMRTDYVLDADGNRTAEYRCSTAHYANRSACTNLTGFQQRQWEADPTRFQRYGKTVYEPKGRFPLYTLAPFYSASAANGADENVALYTGVAVAGGLFVMPAVPDDNIVINRNAFGDPMNRVSSTGVVTNFAYGRLGRARFESSSTGNFALSAYTWCRDPTTADIPAAAPRANCPLGAIFRVSTSSVASTGSNAGQSIAPTRYSYFDRLGREMLATTRIYQQDSSSLNRWSSIATTYDDTGRTKTTTVAYFSMDPTVAQTSSNRAGTPLGSAPAKSTSSYDAIGRSSLVDHPEQAANGASSTAVIFDKLKTEVINPRNFSSRQTKNARDELLSSTDTVGFTVNYDRDPVGNLLRVRRQPGDGDSAGVTLTTSMSYDRLGRKLGMNDPDKGAWTYRYNALGEQIDQVDGKGQTQIAYRDALGRIYKRTENRLTATGFISEPTGTWEYDTALRLTDGSTIKGVPKAEGNGTGGYSREYRYDVQGRLEVMVSTLDGTAYTERLAYDAFGRMSAHVAPSTNINATAGEVTGYSADGYPVTTTDAGTGIRYNEVLALTARAQVRQERFHNASAFTTTRSYDDNTGRLLVLDTASSAGASAVQRWEYTYDKHSDLTSRWNRATGYDLKEEFTYDALDRLKTVTLSRLNGSPVNQLQTVGYDQLGNIKSRVSGANTASWTYGAAGTTGCTRNAGPHAVSAFGSNRYCYDANGNQTEARYPGNLTRLISYTGYDLPETITTNGFPTTTTVSFKYAPDRGMWKRTDGSVNVDRIFCDGFQSAACAGGGGGAGASTTYFVGNLEIRIEGAITTTKRYVGSYLVVTTTNSNPTPQYAYLFRDALGSLDVITDQTGAVQQRLSFDAWGRRRAAEPAGGGAIWSILSPVQAAGFDTTKTRQGYTGHQQVDSVALVHMKGRLYDPELGRFIQADPFVEADATQGLNRYSYVLNNPLTLTDPSGYLSTREWIGLVIAVAASYISQQYWIAEAYWASLAVAVAGGFASAYVATGSWRAGLWGAFAAGVFWGIGAGFSSIQGSSGTGVFGSGYSSGQYAAKVAAHGAAGGVLTELQGGSFGHGFLSAGATQAVSPAIETMPAPVELIANAALGGTISEATGGSFANGAVTGAFQFLFNEAAHRVDEARMRSMYEMAHKMAAEANNGLSMMRFGTEDDAALYFSALATPITRATGLEVAAPIMRDEMGFWLGDLEPSRFLGGNAVSFPSSPGGVRARYVASAHTHPTNSGFSGAYLYWNRKTGVVGGEWGDIGVHVERGINAYVSLPNGAVFRFDYAGFQHAQGNSWTVYAKDHIRQIR